jgi:integrase
VPVVESVRIRYGLLKSGGDRAFLGVSSGVSLVRTPSIPLMLTDAKIKAAKPTDKPRKLADGAGLYLLVKPNGARLWRFKYRHAGKEKLLAFGGYQPGAADHVALAEARARLTDAKRLLRDGIDPSAARHAARHARRDREAGSFESVALEWHAKQSGVWSHGYAAKELAQLKNHVLPSIGGKTFRELKPRDLLDVCRRVEEAGHVETAHRIRRSLGQICRYAVVTHRADSDISTALKGALAPVKTRHFASITEPKRVGDVLRAVQSYKGTVPVQIALQLSPLLFVRPGELRAARWEEFSFDLEDPASGEAPAHLEPQWRIPAERMKMREQHVVPLSRQSVRLLRELHAITGPVGFLFPNARSTSRCMSSNTVNAALRNLGFTKDEMTGHGFRSMASTLLHERGYKSELIERQLAHADRDSSRASYNFAQYLPERRRMMQEWADYLDGVARGGDVIPIRRERRA